MKALGINLPRQTNEYVAMAGFILVVLAAVDIVLVPKWVIPVMGAFLGLNAIGESKQFLLAGLALLAAKWGLNYVPIVGGFAQDLATQLIKFVAPAMLVVSIKSIYYQMKS